MSKPLIFDLSGSSRMESTEASKCDKSMAQDRSDHCWTKNACTGLGAFGGTLVDTPPLRSRRAKGPWEAYP